MFLSQLIYTSEVVPATFRMDRPIEVQLENMLLPARQRNVQLGLTGLLIYSGGHFLQVLEGEVHCLERLYTKIEADKRHRNVRRLALVSLQHRMFSKWSMGLLNLDDRGNIDPRIFEKFQSQIHPGITEEQIAEPLFELLRELKSFLDE